MNKIFNFEAENYDAWYLTPIGKYIDEIETECIFKLISKIKREAILDLGCGSGNYTLKLESHGEIIIGCDIAEKMLEKGVAKLTNKKNKIKFIQANSESLPFKEEVFDLVVCVAAFEFFENPKNAFKEAFRTLKKGGELIIGFLNKNSEWGELYQSDYFKNNTVFKYARLFSKEEANSYFELKPTSFSECLYFSPKIVDVKEAMEIEENVNDKTKEGGFFCAKWIK